MTDFEPPSLEEQLELAHAQLLEYARDLQRVLASKRAQEVDQSTLTDQLDLYARDLRRSLDLEKSLHAKLERSQYEVAMRLTLAAESRESQLKGHLQRIGMMAATIAIRLGLSAEAVKVLHAAAPLHDVGKIGIPDKILLKKGPLNDEEWAKMRSHTELGWQILNGSRSRVLQAAAEIALTHHERWDGSGYPRGLRGERVPMFGRIVSIVDQYDALRSERPYKPAFDHEKVCGILRNGDGRSLPEHFQPEILGAFLEASDEIEEIYNKQSGEAGYGCEPLD